ncbi:MAG TPA: hypothetical protein VN648_14575, partial [Candidatus Methylomirabilis sp.]|nr:hypothetical protein [Candidatus Methylomirabilis sp.]
ARLLRETGMARDKASASDLWRPAGCVAGLLLLAGISAAQTGPTASIANRAAAAAQGISYSDGQLKINVFNTTLSDVLSKVAALTGVTIDVPPGAGVEKMQIVELGPGPARQVLASLLSESNFDYLIQSTDNDQEKIQSVLLMPRGKKDPTPGGIPGSGGGFRSPYGRAAATAAVTPPPPEEPPAPAVPVNLPAGLTPVDPQSPPTLAVQPPPQADPSPQPEVPGPAYAPLDPSALPPQSVLDQPLPQGLTADPSTSRPGALTPPPVMNQQNITQQLQQMYQTRAQMNQPAGSK